MSRSLIAGVLLSFSPVALAGQGDPASVEEEVRRSARQYLDARLANDTAAIRRLLAENFIGVNSNGAVGDLASAMRPPTNVTPNGERIEGFELDSLSVRVYGNTAILVGARRVRVGSGSFGAGVRFTSVFIRSDGRWLLAATQATDILPRRGAR